MEQDQKQFFDLMRLPDQIAMDLRELTKDMMGFDPWRQHLPDWCWMRHAGGFIGPQHRLPLHTSVGYQIGLQFYAVLSGFLKPEEACIPGDTYSLVFYERVNTSGTRSGWYLRIIPFGSPPEYHQLPLEERFDDELPERVLFSALKFAVRKSILEAKAEGAVA